MVNRSFWCGMGLLWTCCLAAQETGLVTHNDFSAQALVLDIFANSACENIDLVTSSGHEKGIGFFENGLETIGIERGIILSTGYTEFAQGPNQATDRSTSLPGPDGDADLELLSGGEIFDAVAIEFDFVPLDSLVEFRYVFASEEYCEFANSNYNDVFGFFVSGPGYAGPFTDDAVNVARLPNSEEYVSINSINHAENPQYYVHNELPDDVSRCELVDVLPQHLETIEYDGFTTVLTAKLRVQVCEVYHMRMVIGDVADAIYDSAVFLEAGSFQLGGEISVEAIGQSAGPNQLYAGCEDAVFRFHRAPGSSQEVPLRINFDVADASTVVPGQDIAALPNEAIIPAGAAYVDLPISSFPAPDMLEDELLRLVLDIPCACYTDSADLFLLPAPELTLELTDGYACPNEPGVLAPQQQGGVWPYAYAWSDGSTNNTLSGPPGATVYEVTVTDLCGQSAEASALIQAATPPVATLAGEAEICWGDTAWFPLTATAIPPLTLTYQIDNNSPQNLTLATLSDFPATLGGQYTLLGVRDAACTGTASGQADLDVWEIMAEGWLQDASCPDVADGSIFVDVLRAADPYTITWTDGPSGPQRTALAAGAYTADISDAKGCVRRYTWTIDHPPPLTGPIFNCDDLFASQLRLSANGGTPPYRYRLSGGLLQDDWPSNLLPGGNYPITLVDQLGCEASLNWTEPAFYPNGMVRLPESIRLPVGVESPLEVDWQLPISLIATIDWDSPLGQLSCENCPYPLLRTLGAELFTLTVTDVFGCSQTLDVELETLDELLVYVPTAFSPNGDEVNDYWHFFANEVQVQRLEEIIVFDRWGNPVFQAVDWPLNSERHGWDGTWKGQPLDAGVFTYWARFRLVNGQRMTRGGEVILMR
ncbi:MAG: choice-of-anchor L domain-containing protein [Bacteroidota bacterium]